MAIGDRSYGIHSSSSEIEDNLFLQFPDVIAFDETYPLTTDLPNNITNETVNEVGQNKLMDAFTLLLGRDTLLKYLASNSPITLDALRGEMQSNANTVIEKANLATHEAGNRSLLAIKLYQKVGLNIAFETDGKLSYYSQLSDNTKFLFAYYLYEQTQNMKNGLLIFDEPDKGFHPTAQADILRFLKSLAAQQNVVVIATHSPYMIDTTLLSGVRLMSSDEGGRLIVKNNFHNPIGKSEDIAIQPILDAIGFTYSRQITLKDRARHY